MLNKLWEPTRYTRIDGIEQPLSIEGPLLVIVRREIGLNQCIVLDESHYLPNTKLWESWYLDVLDLRDLEDLYLISEYFLIVLSVKVVLRWEGVLHCI